MVEAWLGLAWLGLAWKENWMSDKLGEKNSH
jgi:hypothetical protein